MAADDPGLMVWSELGAETAAVGEVLDAAGRSGADAGGCGGVQAGLPSVSDAAGCEEEGLTMSAVPSRPFVDLSVDVLSLCRLRMMRGTMRWW